MQILAQPLDRFGGWLNDNCLSTIRASIYMSKFQGNRCLAVLLGMLPISGLFWLDLIQPLPSLAESRLSISNYEVGNYRVLAQNSQSPDRLKSCRELLGKSQYRLAVKACLEAADHFRSVKNRQGEASALNNLGSAYESQGQYSKAIEYHQQALKIAREIGDRNEEANALGNLGVAYRSQGQYAKAIEYHQQALKIAREIGDRNDEGTTLNNLGAAYQSQGQYAKAIEFYQQALKIARETGDRNGEGATLNNLGVAYKSQGQYAKAIDFYQQALKIKREISDRNGEGTTLNNLGLAYNNQGQYAKAIDFYQQALKIKRETGDRNGEGATLNNLGVAYKSQGQYAKAIDFYQQALKIKREISDRNGEGTTLNNLGVAYKSQGQYAKAIDFYQQALKIKREIGDRNGEGAVLGNLGSAYESQGQYAKAIELYQQALKIAREIGDRNGEGIRLGSLGAAYKSQGQYPKAIDFYQQALKIAREIGDRNEEANALGNLGTIYRSQGQYAKAIDFYQQALKIAREIGDRNGEGSILNNLGAAYQSQGQYAKAIEFYQQALKIARETGDRNDEGAALNNLGAAYQSQGQYAKAIEFYQQALKIAREIGDRNGEGTILGNLGFVLSNQNNPNLAIFFYKQSVKVTESIRKDIENSPESKLAYKETIADGYRRLATLLFQQKRPIEALQVLDLLKVQELQDFLKDVKGNELTAQGVELLPAEKTLLNTLTITPNFNLQTWIDSTSTKTQIARIQAEAKDQTQLKTYKDLQTRLKTLSKDSALFYPLILPDRIELVVLLPNQPPIHRTVPVNQEELEKNIKEYKRYATSASSFKLTKEVSAQLYDWLIKPIAAELKQANIKTIVYAPDGKLRYVPLAGLYDGKRWLIEDYQVNYVTAFSLTSLNKPKISNPKVLAGAYTDSTLPLPNALTEIKAIGKEFSLATLLSGKDFNRAAFTPARLNQFNFIHLATHGKLVSESPELSFISFNNKESINLKEIQNWQLPNVNLVTLSACQSSLGGTESNGIEILGFGYQFQLAKVDATISTLWTVNDRGTSLLMQRFYQYLKQGQSPNAALRLAQIDLIEGQVSSDAQNLSHPLYWAPFILVGNGF